MKLLFYSLIFWVIPLMSAPQIAQPKEKTAPQELPDYDKVIFQWSKSFAEVIHIINKKYHEPINPEKGMINAINAFLNTLDPHSDFMDKKKYKDIIETTQGEFYGIGVIIDYMKENDQEFLKIIDIVHGGPADNGGVRAEDLIVQVNNESLKGMSVEEIVAKLKGKKNTEVHIKIKRANNPELLSFTLKRDVVKEQDALCYYFKDHAIYYLSLRMFTENSVKQLEQLLKKCQQTTKGLILDLRNNSGGLLSAVTDIAGLFLPINSLVVTTKERERQVDYKTTREPINKCTMPIFILINNFTASAAEILAGCLRHHSETNNKIPFVFLVGSKTFGKGSVQEVIPINNDCAAKVTTSLYYLPNDISIQSVGIEPDFSIEQRIAPTKEMQWFNKFFGYESSLKNAIKNKDVPPLTQKDDAVTDAKEKEKTWQEKKKEQIGTDYIILSTLRLIEMYSMAKKAYPQELTTRKDVVSFLRKNYITSDALTMEEITV